MKKKLAIALSLLMLASGLVSCGGPVEDIMKKIKREKYAETIVCQCSYCITFD